MEEQNSFTIIGTRDADESSMVVTLDPDGRITIQDYSHQNESERETLIALLKERGVETDLVYETLMDFHTIPGHKQKIYEQLTSGKGEGNGANQ